jgi:hypothetical protein
MQAEGDVSFAIHIPVDVSVVGEPHALDKSRRSEQVSRSIGGVRTKTSLVRVGLLLRPAWNLIHQTL